MTGKPYSSFRTKKAKERPFRILKFGLRREREELYERIHRRVDMMIENGLIEEARKVYPHKDYNSLNTVGYKELFKYFDGEWTLDEAIDKIKQNTRLYSRKQTTWYRRDEEVVWLEPAHQTIDEMIECINDRIRQS
jgi:tRNA dimethylallyltransferase